MTYRKVWGTDTWHFCQNCSNWPKVAYQEQEEPPPWGHICHECKAKDIKGECQK